MCIGEVEVKFYAFLTSAPVVNFMLQRFYSRSEGLCYALDTALGEARGGLDTVVEERIVVSVCLSVCFYPESNWSISL